MNHSTQTDVPRFDHTDFGSEHHLTRIGSGAIGGKANGLRMIQDEILPRFDTAEFPETSVEGPRFVVIATDVFTAFMDRNQLWETVQGDFPDSHIAQEFQHGELPPDVIDDLRGLISVMLAPLALRPSSLLEETHDRPLAGVYTTKMLPNSESSEEARFQRFASGLKLVWASTFFANPEISRRAAGLGNEQEKMAVIVQEVFGERRGERFYPTLSAIARSFNQYPTPDTKPEEGFVSLGLGLGKIIIDGGHTWNYCPERPTARPPFKNTADLLKNTQNQFWAINIGEPPPADPLRETECLVRSGLADAELDGTLKYLVSTYDPASDRLTPGLDARGPRALTFAPLLQSSTNRLPELIDRLLEVTCEVLGGEAEIEVAVELDPASGQPKKLGFMQVRSMMSPGERFPIAEGDLDTEDVLVASNNCLGHGIRKDVADVVYVRPQTFNRSDTRTIATELEAVNRGLVEEGRHGIFIGLGRWGTTDDWSGVPVVWAQISAARVIVEVALPDTMTDSSQGTHFFHRLLSYQVLYMSVDENGPDRIDWDWLDAQPTVWESRYLRQVRLDRPLEAKVDGVTRRGVVRRESE